MEAAVERNHRIELQYDGTGLHGWAKQEGLLTVEGCLEEALRTVLGSPRAMRVAGRTDSGVHARRQVVSLALPADTDLSRLRASLNALTPPGIVITRLEPAPRRFDARRDASSRIYRYYLSTSSAVSPFWGRYCWHVPWSLNMTAMSDAAALVVGPHDFTAFTPRETEHAFLHRQVLRCSWLPVRDGLPGSRLEERDDTSGTGTGLMYLEIEAESFLRHMVRVLVGTMVEIGGGKQSLDKFRLLLEAAPREEAGPTAPSHGLFLWDVKYRPGRKVSAPGSSAS